MKVYISTNGCEEGRLNSAILKHFFARNGATVTSNASQADFIIFYACGLTEEREKDSLAVLKKLKNKSKYSSKIVVWGCLPKISPESVSQFLEGPIVGPTEFSYFQGFFEKPTITFNEIMESQAADRLIPAETFEACDRIVVGDAVANMILWFKQEWERLKAYAHKNVRFYIRTSVGCTGRCTYCSERCAFGRIKSRPIEKILSEFKLGLRQGYNTFSLIATDLGAYGRDTGCTLQELLAKMIEAGEGKTYKILLNQLGPSYLIEMFSGLKEVFASGKIEALNCPVQSGSNRILRLMGRTYTAEEWREHMLRINEKYPSIKLSTHFMVGFPTETEEDFNATLNLLDYPLFLHNIWIFKFSKRPRVYASLVQGQVSEKTKELRYKKLMQKYAYLFFLNYVHRSLRVFQSHV